MSSISTAAPSAHPPAAKPLPAPGDRYKWTALSNTTLGTFIASLDVSIVLISVPAIFRGIGLDPPTPSNIGYLLWMLMGYLVVTAVLVVTFGRLGDMFDRVRMCNGVSLLHTRLGRLVADAGQGRLGGDVADRLRGRTGHRPHLRTATSRLQRHGLDRTVGAG